MAPKRIDTTRSSNTSSTPQHRPDPDAMIADLLCEASGLSAVTGAKVAVVAIKPDGEVVQYGCPSVDAVFGRYLGAASAAAAVPSDLEAIDWIVRAYVERKRAEDSRYGERTAKDRELKDLRWVCKILQRLRATVASD